MKLSGRKSVITVDEEGRLFVFPETRESEDWERTAEREEFSGEDEADRSEIAGWAGTAESAARAGKVDKSDRTDITDNKNINDDRYKTDDKVDKDNKYIKDGKVDKYKTDDEFDKDNKDTIGNKDTIDDKYISDDEVDKDDIYITNDEVDEDNKDTIDDKYITDDEDNKDIKDNKDNRDKIDKGERADKKKLVERVAILGAGGRTGRALVEFFGKKQIEMILFDRKSADSLKEEFAELQQYSRFYHWAKGPEELLEAQLVIPSPGIPPENELIKLAQRERIPLISELELAYHFSPAWIAAVTGTNGKTTTTRLTARLLDAGLKEKVVLAGNIGRPAISAVGEVSAGDWLVLEVSSFQLAACQNFRPEIAIFINFAADHLDWHGTLEDYREAKARIFLNQTREDLALVNLDDPEVKKLARTSAARVLGVSSYPESGADAVIDGSVRICWKRSALDKKDRIFARDLAEIPWGKEHNKGEDKKDKVEGKFEDIGEGKSTGKGENEVADKDEDKDKDKEKEDKFDSKDEDKVEGKDKDTGEGKDEDKVEGKGKRKGEGRGEGGNDSETLSVLREEPDKVLIIKNEEIKLKGSHNKVNVALAVLAARELGVSAEVIREVVRDFEADPHRLEIFYREAELMLIDDSKATNPPAAVEALKSCAEFRGEVIIIAGGQDRGQDNRAFAREIARRADGAVLLGETASQLAAEFNSLEYNSYCKVESIEEAALQGLKFLENKELKGVLLLSPGAPSWDMFSSYRERGRLFQEACENYLAGG